MILGLAPQALCCRSLRELLPAPTAIATRVLLVKDTEVTLQTWSVLNPYLNILCNRRNQTLHFVDEHLVNVLVVRDEVIQPASGPRQGAQQIIVKIEPDTDSREIDSLCVLHL